MKKTFIWLLILAFSLKKISIQAMTTITRTRSIPKRTRTAALSRSLPQIRRFHTSPPPLKPSKISDKPQQSFWQKAYAFMLGKPEPLNAEKIRNLTHGTVKPNPNYKTGWDPKYISELDDEALENAKNQLGSMIDNYPEYKDKIIENFPYFVYFNVQQRPFNLTLLDEVLLQFFLTGEAGGSWKIFKPSEKSMKQLELLQYLITKGANINPDNVGSWKNGIHVLFDSAKGLYEKDTWRSSNPKHDLALFKEIFTQLEPIIRQILPELLNEFHTLQKDLSAIESNPEEYAKKMEDEYNRSKFYSKKARDFEMAYRKQTGNWDTYSYEFHPYVDQYKEQNPKSYESEYQEWLRLEKMREENPFKFRYNFKFEQQSDESLKSPLQRITEALKIPETSSHAKIKEAFFQFSQKNHPDKFPKNEKEQKEKEFKEVSEAWNDYNASIKEQMAKE